GDRAHRRAMPPALGRPVIHGSGDGFVQRVLDAERRSACGDVDKGAVRYLADERADIGECPLSVLSVTGSRAGARLATESRIRLPMARMISPREIFETPS